MRIGVPRFGGGTLSLHTEPSTLRRKLNGVLEALVDVGIQPFYLRRLVLDTVDAGRQVGAGQRLEDFLAALGVDAHVGPDGARLHAALRAVRFCLRRRSTLAAGVLARVFGHRSLRHNGFQVFVDRVEQLAKPFVRGRRCTGILVAGQLVEVALRIADYAFVFLFGQQACLLDGVLGLCRHARLRKVSYIYSAT